MEYILFGIISSFIWIGFEMWRAPMIDERTGKTIKKGKTLKDLFKKKEIKNSSNSYSDLEKYGRGRSKY